MAPSQAVLSDIGRADAVERAVQQPSLAVLGGMDVPHGRPRADLHSPPQQRLQLRHLPHARWVKALRLVDQHLHPDVAPRRTLQLIREAVRVK
eukprot:10792185-Alexandrium_andersonii.AAC.1